MRIASAQLPSRPYPAVGAVATERRLAMMILLAILFVSLGFVVYRPLLEQRGVGS
jgi:hypothetical protein